MAKETIRIYGTHAVSAVCEHHPERVYQVYVARSNRESRSTAIEAMAAIHDIPVRHAAASELDKLSQGGSHQGVLAECRAPEMGSVGDLQNIVEKANCPLLLLLDGVQDPHNLGACLRSANAMGVDAVVAPKHDSCGLTAVVHKVSCGASLLTPFIRVSNLARTMESLAKQGVWLVGLDAETPQLLQDVDLCCPIALVLGAEGGGLRRLSREKCDHLAKLPMSGDMESLNVSVATGMALYEVVRQRS